MKRKPFRILLVDDNPDDRELILREFRKEAIELDIQHVINREEWQSALETGIMDIVVSDYHLRWSDGLTILNELKAKYPACPIIMFTASGNEEVAVEAMKIGLDDYIIKKPSHLARLRGALVSAINQIEEQRHMKDLEGRFLSVLGHLTVGVFRCNLQGDYLETNQAMSRLLGTVKNDLGEDEPFPFLKAIENSQCVWKDCVELLKNLTGAHAKDVHMTNASGEMFWGHLNLILTTAATGQQVIDGLLEDVSDRKKMESVAIEQAIASTKLSCLTPRENDVCLGVVDGKQNKMIAADLNLSEKTIEKHRSKLMKKLEVRSVAELVKLVMTASISIRPYGQTESNSV